MAFIGYILLLIIEIPFYLHEHNRKMPKLQ